MGSVKWYQSRFLYLIFTILLLIQMEDNYAISFSKYNRISQVRGHSQGGRIRPSLQDSSSSILPNQVQYDPSGEDLEEVESEVPNYVVGSK